MPINTTKAMEKSNKHANTDDKGIMSLGKYTLDIKFALPTRLLPEPVIEFAK